MSQQTTQDVRIKMGTLPPGSTVLTHLPGGTPVVAAATNAGGAAAAGATGATPTPVPTDGSAPTGAVLDTGTTAGDAGMNAA